MNFPILYGRSSNGKMKSWKIESVQESDGTASINTYYGYVDGETQTTTKHITVGKNLGKSNETTPYAQATSDARSDWNKKKDSGYVEDPLNIPEESKVDLFLPMLAHKWTDRAKDITFPAFVQPKLDGIRCLAKKENGKVTLWSRQGKILPIPTKIIAELEQTGNGFKDGDFYDGELYVHGWEFQRVTAAVKKYREDTDLLEYHVYDRPHPTRTFEERYVLPSVRDTDHVKGVETTLVKSADEIQGKLEDFISLGYEGLIIRNEAGLYKYGHRSVDLQKYKEFEDAEFIITGGKEATGRDEGTVVFECKTENDLPFDVRPRGSHELRTKYFNELASCIGKPLTVRFQGRSNEGVPRFPVGIAIRDYE